MTADRSGAGVSRIRVVILALCIAWSATAGAAPFSGRPVQDVLRELGAGGINFIYNTELVPPGLTVLEEPAAGAPVDVARQILAVHGLALSEVGENAYAVVRDGARGRAGAGTIAGTVLGVDDQPVNGARVVLDGSARIAAADGTGSFRFTGVAPGRHRLDAAAEGFSPGAATGVRVRAGRTSEIRITLAAAAPELAEIVVTTSRYALAYSEPQTHTFLTQADVQALPKLADEPLRSIQRLPGSASAGISALTHIRGGEHDEVLMVLDGLPLVEPFHLRSFLAPVSLFDAEAIESMDVSSGGFTADYGDRMSGVVDITSLSPPDDRYTEVGLSLFHASLLSAGTFAGDRGEWLASVRRSNLDLISRAVNSDVGEPEYFDAFGRVSFALTDTTSLTGGALTSRDELEANTSDKTERADAEYRNTYVWGGWEQAWPGRFESRLILALTDLDTSRVGSIAKPGQQEGSVDERRTLRTGVGRLDISHKADRVYTRFGIEGREVRAKYHYSSTNTFAPGYPFPGDPGGTVTRDLDPEPDGHQLAAYVTSRARVTDRLNAEIGLRWDGQTYDDDDENGPEQFSPRLNFMYDITPDTRVRAAWGRFWQAQGSNELQVEDGVDTFYNPQRADHLILSFEQNLPRELDLRIELYQKDYDRIRPHFENLFDPVKLLPELEADRIEVDPDRARARGAELLLSRQDKGPWAWWASYAWARVTDRIGGEDVRRSWDQRHSVNAGLRYTGQHWEFTVTDGYHTGWPTTALLLADDPLGGPDVVTVGERNADSFSHYNSLDLRVMRRFDLPDSTLEAFFELTNALAQRNPCCVEYEVTAPGGEPVIDKDVDYWPRFIPSIGVLWKF